MKTSARYVPILRLTDEVCDRRPARRLSMAVTEIRLSSARHLAGDITRAISRRLSDRTPYQETPMKRSFLLLGTLTLIAGAWYGGRSERRREMALVISPAR